MMRQRLRESAAVDYQVARSNFNWMDHTARLLVTGGLIAWLGPKTICDPACGDGSVLGAAYELNPFRLAILSDVSVPSIEGLNVLYPHEAAVGDLMDTMNSIVQVDAIVLTEILEHIEDPDAALRLARQKAGGLIASSPIGDPEDGRNHEHLWAWDIEGYGEMLAETGWTAVNLTTILFPGDMQRFQVWVAK